ncbi:metal ABC transporter solute-binding protein, Zn/Mn family [Sporosarcina ureae]|uniref:metal ABC transporter solute-binding protein, Zn/Mn family n=1 Tax=Sporosarcina ureae TaxID=1571 RepID=UPI0009DC7AC9|nr:zinc ABC transporter substrate-binding protein [Sporosarcina ureae]ARF16844.1 adhesin [Sporosarcina ureae]
MSKWFLATLSVIVLSLLTACGNKEQVKENVKEKVEPESSEDILSVYTTAYPLQYFTERIGGDTVDVHSIYPPGADEHTFTPTQNDMMALADSDLFFYIGLGLEGFVEGAEETMKSEHVKMIAVADNISKELLGNVNDDVVHDLHDEAEEVHDSHEEAEEVHDEHNEAEEAHDDHEHGEFDPHVWISPILSIELATTIKDSLIEASPEKKDTFEQNFETLKKDLLELDQKFKDMASNAPIKTFFVSHAAFGYIADTYGLKQVAVAGLNSQSEPSQKQLASLVEYAKTQDLKYVLFEQNVSSKLTDVIRKEIGADSLMLHNLGVLTTKDLDNKEDYFSLMEYNIETLSKALSNK